MWVGGICTSVICVLAIVGLSLNSLATKHGTSDELPEEDGETGKVEADIYFGHSQFKMEVTYLSDDTETSRKTYHTAKNMACNNASYVGEYQDDDYCDEMRHLMQSGAIYKGLYVTAMALVIFVSVLSFVVAIAQRKFNFEPDEMHCQVFAAVLLFIAMSFWIGAFFVFYFILVQDLSDTMTFVISVYYPDVSGLITNWENGKPGASLILLIICVVLLFFGFPIAIFVGRPDEDDVEYEIVYEDVDEDGVTIASSTPQPLNGADSRDLYTDANL